MGENQLFLARQDLMGSTHLAGSRRWSVKTKSMPGKQVRRTTFSLLYSLIEFLAYAVIEEFEDTGTRLINTFLTLSHAL